MRYPRVVWTTLAIACGCGTAPRAQVIASAASGDCENAGAFLSAHPRRPAVANAIKRVVGYPISYVASGVGYVTDGVLVAVEGVVIGGVICAPVIAAQAATGSGTLPAACFEKAIDALPGDRLLPGFGSGIFNATAGLRCNDVTPLSRELRLIAQCYARRGDTPSLQRAREQLAVVRASPAIYRCVSKAEREAIDADLAALAGVPPMEAPRRSAQPQAPAPEAPRDSGLLRAPAHDDVRGEVASDHPLERAHSELEQARKAWLEFDYDAVRSHEALAWALSAMAEDPATMIEALSLRGLVELSFENYEIAQRYFEQSRALAESSGNRVELATQLHNLASCRLRLGAPEEAWKLALESVRADPGSPALDATKRIMALATAASGNHDPAQFMLKHLAAEAERAGDSRGLGRALLALGEVEATGEAGDARSSYLAALDAARAAKDRDTEWRAHYGLAKVATAEGNTAEARARARDARAILVDAHIHESVDGVHRSFDDVFAMAGTVTLGNEK